MTKGNHYAAAARKAPRPICPTCGNVARETQTKYGLRSMCCGLWSWDRHPLVDGDTHAARNVAHKTFDDLWRGGKMDRREAYRRLADQMNLTPDQCHMKLMDRETALMVPIAVAAIVAEAPQ